MRKMIYLPDELAERMEEIDAKLGERSRGAMVKGASVNWSKVAQIAFEKFIAKTEKDLLSD